METTIESIRKTVNTIAEAGVFGIMAEHTDAGRQRAYDLALSELNGVRMVVRAIDRYNELSGDTENALLNANDRLRRAVSECAVGRIVVA